MELVQNVRYKWWDCHRKEGHQQEDGHLVPEPYLDRALDHDIVKREAVDSCTHTKYGLDQHGRSTRE